jgi:alpha-N-arabinofuranosidase
MQGKDAANRMNAPGRLGVVGVVMLLGALIALSGSPIASAGQGHRTHTAEIVVHPGDGLRRVHPGLFGVNHRYPYDGFGMWDPATRSVPKLFDERFAAARFSAVRFPGGLVANTYHWKRAIGPVSARGLNVHGRTGEPLTNEFGSDEFGRFVAERGLESTMLANFATGTAQEAADWVEYMNAPVGTNPNGGVAWADRRDANGHPEPYDVRNWEIGNEMYQLGQSYWMGDGTLAERTRKYVFGGSTTFTEQRVGTPWDHQDSAAISDGSASQAFQVRYPPVKPDGRFVLTVDDAVWTRVDDLSDAPSGATVYELDPSSGRITFGDGVHGAIPPNESVVRASYTSGPHDGFVDFYDAMKAADPGIQVGSCFRNRLFLSLMGQDHPYDFVVAHIYSHMPPPGFRGAKQFHDGMMAIAGERANLVSKLRRSIAASAGAEAKMINIVVSEYGMALGDQKGPTKNYLRSMDQALYVALELQRWMQLGVPLAGKHSLIDFHPTHAPPGARALGSTEQALIGGAPHYIASATARTFRLLTRASGDQVVRAAVRSDPSRRIYTGTKLKLLHARATKGSDGSLYVTVVNTSRKRKVPITVSVKGRRVRSAVVRELVGPSFLAYNSVSHPHRVEIRTHYRSVLSRRMRLKLAPHSVTTLDLRRRPG